MLPDARMLLFLKNFYLMYIKRPCTYPKEMKKIIEINYNYNDRIYNELQIYL